MWKNYLIVMFGGAIGTGMRMALATWLGNRYGDTFPIGTLVVNVTGCFLIGIFAALTGPEGIFFTSPLTRLFVMVGLCGGYTTFSAFSLQTLDLWQQGEWLRGGLYVLLSVILCLVAVWLGSLAAAPFHHR